MIELGIIQASNTPIRTPLPISWINRADAPGEVPAWASIGVLTGVQLRNLQAQIGYDKSTWDYSKIGTNNELGRYQFTSTTLESYGLLITGSNKSYGNDCVNYKNCWKQMAIRSTNSYGNYLYDLKSLGEFLGSTVGQDHLSYQILYDTYTMLLQSGAVTENDSAEVLAGMMYVGWELGNAAYQWRYENIGNGAAAFNSGRYAIVVLSQ